MTPNQRLAAVMLGEPVEQWIAKQRAEGKPWRTVADDLRTRTNGQVDVSHEALRRWVSGADDPEAGAA